MKPRVLFLLILVLILLIAGVLGWIQYRQVRADYDAYRSRIQQGVRLAAVDVGWHTPEEARKKVMDWVAKPYYQDLTLHYQDEAIPLSPGDDLAFTIPVDEMVAEAMAASHQYDYWDGSRARQKRSTWISRCRWAMTRARPSAF
jgi:hypothetical protein